MIASTMKAVCLVLTSTVGLLPSTKSSASELAFAPCTRVPSHFVCMSSGPKRGEIRNPWGRAGKPETRAARLADMAESATLRAKAWRYALARDYNQPWTEENLQVLFQLP